MYDVIAVEVRLADGGFRYFVTWGRIQDAVDPDPVCRLALKAARGFSLGGGEPVSARVCGTLREAADSPDAPYFYECFRSFCEKPIPFGRRYEKWRAARAREMENGMAWAYCGVPPPR